VNLGPGRTATAITAGLNHNCAILDNGSVRCWGYGLAGRLGYGNTHNVGDTPVTIPGRVGPVDLGAGRTAKAIAAGAEHTCALLDNDSVRCWGYGANGRLGDCRTNDVGEAPATIPGKVGPVNLRPGDGGARCASPGPKPRGSGHPSDPRHLETGRAHGLHSCLASAAHRGKRQRSRANGDCLRRYGRTPDRVTRLHARALSGTNVLLTFAAPGTDGASAPAARAYLVKQSRQPFHGARDFRTAQSLCHGSCRFKVTAVGTRIKLTIFHLRPRSTYYYAIPGRDNVSGTLGPRSPTVLVRTR